VTIGTEKGGALKKTSPLPGPAGGASVRAESEIATTAALVFRCSSAGQSGEERPVGEGPEKGLIPASAPIVGLARRSGGVGVIGFQRHGRAAKVRQATASDGASPVAYVLSGSAPRLGPPNAEARSRAQIH